MSGSLTKCDVMRVVRLARVQDETEDLRSLFFEDEACSNAEPGQYIMIWRPEAEEVPMSLSTIGQDGVSAVTIRDVGETTRILSGLKEGDKVGVRGPFGNGFTIHGDSPLLVSGGSGAASLTPLVENMASRGLKPTFVLGGRSSDQLLFRDRLEGLLGERLHVSTDNGSNGYWGYASQLAKELLEVHEFDHVYTCGPELMMVAVFDEAEIRGIPVQASLERYIKCAVGLCGSCAIGPYRICRDGPVLNTEQLREVREELGKTRMDPSGRVIRVDH